MENAELLKNEIIKMLEVYCSDNFATKEELESLAISINAKIQTSDLRYEELKKLLMENREDVNTLKGMFDFKIAQLIESVDKTNADIKTSLSDQGDMIAIALKESKKTTFDKMYDKMPRAIKFVMVFIIMFIVEIVSTAFFPDTGNAFMKTYGFIPLGINLMIATYTARKE